MSKLAIVGTVALDSIETPFESGEEILGGSAVYSCLGASLFTKVGICAVVGGDFPEPHTRLLRSAGVDTGGLEAADGETFRWKGRYSEDLGDPETVFVRLNVYENFKPKLTDRLRNAEFVFLANMDPAVQMEVLEQVKSPRAVACDTMNYWIENSPEDLRKILKKVNILIINNSEALDLSGEKSIAAAAREIMKMGPRTVVIKRGEFGSVMFSDEDVFCAPAYLVEKAIDPTGAGDTFAGGFMGYLSANGAGSASDMKKAVIYGSVLASFTVESLGTESIKTLSKEKFESRFREFMRMSQI
ncbi:MAG: PfkB family carbohydrate kinase [Candidatus Dadabacteria bacterium]|nr:PfkB family carbohydrate kinase [Candidatus Dadabacteria bacterium]